MPFFLAMPDKLGYRDDVRPLVVVESTVADREMQVGRYICPGVEHDRVAMLRIVFGEGRLPGTAPRCWPGFVPRVGARPPESTPPR